MTPGSQMANGPAVKPCGAIVPQRIRLDLRVRDKAALLVWLAESAAASTGLDQAAILAVLRKREALGSTGVGSAIALRWFGLFEQVLGVFQVDIRLVYAAAASSISALK